MPAHTRSLDRQCIRCHKRAVVEVFNTSNASMGSFCKRHGDERVQELNGDTAA